MKISFNWLKELTDLPWTPEQTAEKLSSLGFPVEKIHRTGVQAAGVVAVKILGVDKHPNADRLRLATITDGTEQKTIVCGAPNIAVGQVVPMAQVGARLPGGVEITLSKIRGVESAGMLCSERELGLSEEHAGILQLPGSTALGTPIGDVLGGPDTILEIEVTPNRPDVLSHIGIARDLAALAKVALRLPDESLSAGSGSFPISIDEPSLCFRYLGQVLSGVKVGPSPQWLSRRLTDCGIRSINNVVDVTNYVLLEWGHPLHAFDLAKLQGPEIRVRRATKGEKFLALDERTYELNESDLVIADKARAVALAGIMGGQDSGVTNGTTDILLESAVFDRAGIRLTSKRLALRSESSIRFEKGTDADTARHAWNRAAKLIHDLAGGTPGASRDVHPAPAATDTVTLRRAKLDALLGVSIPDAAVADALTRLHFAPKPEKGGWTCAVPPFRKDVADEADLIEEVIRIVGYDAVPASLSNVRVGRVLKEHRLVDVPRVRQCLRGFGMTETLTTTFCSADLPARFGIAPTDVIKLANPLSQEESALRPLLAINLLRAVQRNLNHQRSSVRLFEIGRVFQQKEQPHLGLVVAGKVQEKAWNQPELNVDVFFLKGLLEHLSLHAGAALELTPGGTPEFLHPNQSFTVSVGGRKLGWAGLLSPRLAGELGIEAPCAVAEMHLAAFMETLPVRAAALPKYPFVERDIAVVVAKSVAWGVIEGESKKAAGNLLVTIRPFDVFEGGSLAADQKSVAFRIRLQDPAKTLTEADINGVVDRIKTTLQKACGAQLR